MNMAEELKSASHQESRGMLPARTEVVREIYSNPLSTEDKKIVGERVKFYETGDEEVFDKVEKLREEVGAIEGWKKTKEKARDELGSVPSDVLERILERFSPFIKNLPAGHSKGHFLRDTVNLSMAFQDPSLANYDATEVFVGMFGAMFHDIGNSVVDRYAEQKRFSGHAEIGAHLFGEVSKGLIGDNLQKMVMLAIAGHTHYTKDRIVEKNGETRTTKPYEDDVVDGNRMAFWWARQADRMDAQGAIMDVRHFITKAEPTEDYGGDGEFHQVWDTQENDFKHQFRPVFRTAEERASKEKPESTPNVLEHVKMFADSNFNDKLPYAKHDSPFYTRLIQEAAQDQDEFIGAVVGEKPNLSTQEMNTAFERFFKMCEIIEPAQNTKAQIVIMRRKFNLLAENERSQWANGFRILTGRIYPRRYERFKAILNYPTPANIQDKNESARLKVKDIINNHMYPLAAEVWEQFSPSKLSLK